jgi:hypothetical protein
MTLRHLPNMLKLSTIKWKRHKSSRYLPEFNATSNALLAAVKKSKALGGVRG